MGDENGADAQVRIRGTRGTQGLHDLGDMPVSIADGIGVGSPTHAGEGEVRTTRLPGPRGPHYQGHCRLRGVDEVDQRRQTEGHR